MEYRYVAADIREYLHIADSRYHIFTTAEVFYIGTANENAAGYASRLAFCEA